MATGEKKVSLMNHIASAPGDTKIYIVLDDGSYGYILKSEFLDGSASKTPVNIRSQYNGTSVTVPADFTLTRIISLNDPNTEFAGVVTGPSLVITDGVTNDIYLIDGYTI